MSPSWESLCGRPDLFCIDARRRNVEGDRQVRQVGHAAEYRIESMSGHSRRLSFVCWCTEEA